MTELYAIAFTLLGGVAALVAAFTKGKRSERKARKVKDLRDYQNQLEEMRNANDRNLDDDAVADSLRDHAK